MVRAKPVRRSGGEGVARAMALFGVRAQNIPSELQHLRLWCRVVLAVAEPGGPMREDAVRGLHQDRVLGRVVRTGSREGSRTCSGRGVGGRSPRDCGPRRGRSGRPETREYVITPNRMTRAATYWIVSGRLLPAKLPVICHASNSVTTARIALTRSHPYDFHRCRFATSPNMTACCDTPASAAAFWICSSAVRDSSSIPPGLLPCRRDLSDRRLGLASSARQSPPDHVPTCARMGVRLV